MPTPPVQHESLTLPGYWRITTFGTLTDNPLNAHSDLRIRAYLAPLGNLDGSSPKNAETLKVIRPMLLPIGELPRLHLNAVLHDGKLISDQTLHLRVEHKFNRLLDCSRSNIRIIRRRDLDDSGAPIIPVRKDWKDLTTDPEMHGLFIAIGSISDPYATIIPAIEVFRFFYATSDVLAKALLRDDFLDPETNLWNPEKTAIRPDGCAVLWLRKRMLDADARFLARFAFDEYALFQAQQIFLHAAAIGTSEGARLIRALPPFEDTVATEFYGCPIEGPNGKRVLVTRLLQCHWHPPFTALKWDRDNDGRYDPDRRQERPPSDWSPRLSVPKQDDPTPTSLASSAPTTPNVPSRLREAEIFERFPGLGAIPAEKLPQENAETRADHRDWRPVMQEAYRGSVVDGLSSRDLVGKTILEGLERKPAPPTVQTDEVDISVGQADYLTVLQLLQTIERLGLANVKFLTVLKSAKITCDAAFNVYPKEIDAKQKAWLYVDDQKRSSRIALVAEVEQNQLKRYVIELQQKKPGECSTLVVWNHSERRIPQGLLGHLLLDCAKAGTARLDSAPRFSLMWGRLHHTTKTVDEKSAEHFLSRIFEEVKMVSPTKHCPHSSHGLSVETHVE